jgi:hypothetical protein
MDMKPFDINLAKAGKPVCTFSSMRIFNISPEIAIQVMDEQVEVMKKRLRELNVIAKIELEANDKQRKEARNDNT